MRKFPAILAAVLIALGVAGLGFGQQAYTAPKPAHPPTKVVVGTVETVTLADPAAATKSEIAIINKAKAKLMFLVKPTTTIYDTKGKPLTLDKVVKGEEIRVRYTTTTEGVCEATAIRVIK
jgi:hypothetical protein